MIGRGGMSVVYLAEHLRLNRMVALKLLAPDLAEDERFGERFARGSEGGDEHVYLSDFGLTKRAFSDSGITATGQFVGTLDYAAPEQFEGKQLDGRTDQYSLGCVLYECLTGAVPFQKDQEAALM